MVKRVLFVGAGASFGARLTHQVRPPLGPDLCRWLRKVTPLLENETGLIDLQYEISDATRLLEAHRDDDNFEKLVAKLDRKERAILHRVLLITFSDIGSRTHLRVSVSNADFGFRFQSDGYDRLSSKLNLGNGTWSIVSLNYDLLLEEALRRNNIEFFYPEFPFQFGSDQSKANGLKIYKPHGAINLFAHGDNKIFHREPLPTDDRGLPTSYFKDAAGNVTPTHPIVMAVPPGLENVLSIADSSTISEPVIANYTKGKASDTNQKTLEEVRRSAIKAIKEADEVVVIGVRPIFDSEDDRFVAEALSVQIPDLTYVAANREECAEIKKLHPEAVTFSGGLQEFLEVDRLL